MSTSITSSSEWRYNVITFCSVVIIIISTILFLTIKKLYCTTSKDLLSIHQPLKLFAIGEMICYLLSYIFALLTTGIYTTQSIFHQIFLGLFVLWLIMGLMSSYLFLVYRYYFTFLDSTFSMKRRSFYFHIFVVISIPTYLIFAVYFYYIHLYSFLVISCIFGIGLTFIAYLLLIYQFNHNLFKLVLKHRQETTTKVKKWQSRNHRKPSLNDQKTESSSLNTHQLFMIEQITKQTLLGSFHVGCILIIVLLCISFFISTTFLSEHMFADIVTKRSDIDLYFMIIFSWSFTITITVGVICVYLGFIFNAKIYQCLCSQCHLKCQKFCENLAERRIEKLEEFDRMESELRMSSKMKMSSNSRMESLDVMNINHENRFNNSMNSVVSTPGTTTFVDLEVGDGMEIGDKFIYGDCIEMEMNNKDKTVEIGIIEHKSIDTPHSEISVDEDEDIDIEISEEVP